LSSNTLLRAYFYATKNRRACVIKTVDKVFGKWEASEFLQLDLNVGTPANPPMASVSEIRHTSRINGGASQGPVAAITGLAPFTLRTVLQVTVSRWKLVPSRAFNEAKGHPPHVKSGAFP
jgi:hypothetical protein